MLPPAAFDALHRLANTLAPLAHAVADIVRTSGTPAFAEDAAHAFFLRLVAFIARLVRIGTTGIPAIRHRAQPASPAIPAPSPAGRDGAGFVLRLPRRRGWLLDALPGFAPAIAADLRTLLADPALAGLLAAAPCLHRSLTPLLRSLGLPPPPSPAPAAPPPVTPPPVAPPPSPPASRHTPLLPLPENRPPASASSYA